MEPVSTESAQPAAETQPTGTTAPNPPLIGDVMRRPAWLWLTHVIPAIVLFLSFFHAYYLISGETNATQRQTAGALAAGLIVLTVAVGVCAIRWERRRQTISNVAAVGLFAVSALMAGAGIAFISYVVPPSIPSWILSISELISCSFVLGMPGAFYALVLLASYPKGSTKRAVATIAIFLVTIFALPWVMYGLVRLIGLLDFQLPYRLMSWLMWPLLIAGATGFCFGTIRVTLMAYHLIRRQGAGIQWTFMFLVAMAGPLGGLWLNQGIPFPVNFQAPIIYMLAIINGALLMCPAVNSAFWRRAIWLAQCVMLTFSAYFLLVFLPWLPLVPLALIAAGGGALILVPIVLGLVHGYRVIDGYREEIRDGSAWKPVVLGLIAVSLLPAGYGVRLWQDRQALHQALTYYYSPDYRKDITFPGNLDRLEETLQHLRDMKHGIWLPFLSPLYNAVVFDNLVLPDSKIDALQLAFFGTPAAGGRASLLEPMGSSSRGWEGRTTRIPPPQDAVLKDVQVEPQYPDLSGTTRLTLTMENPTARQSEFVTSLKIPEGVYVSDFGLYIGQQLVAGKIVEKKTALWVYEKISVVERRDPGILTYKSRTDLELRVFPLAAGEKRRVVIELTYPPLLSVNAKVGDRNLSLGASFMSSIVPSSACWTPEQSAVFPGDDERKKTIQRQPYIHLLIDCSRESDHYTVEQLRRAVADARRTVPEARMIKISAANFEIRDLTDGLVSPDQIDFAAIQQRLLPMRGGFLQDRVLKRSLLLADDFAQTGTQNASLRPQFVIITRQEAPVEVAAKLREGNLDAFLRRVPDAKVVYVQERNGALQAHDLVTREPVSRFTPLHVSLWQWGKYVAVSDGNPALFPAGVEVGAVPQLYDAKTGQFITPPTGVKSIPSDSRYADGVRTWAAQELAYFQPSAGGHQSAATLRLGKKTRILTTDAAYIVVENSAQWKAMEEKEKQKLASNQAFEIEEPETTPEPSTVVLLFGGLAALLLWRRYGYAALAKGTAHRS